MSLQYIPSSICCTKFMQTEARSFVYKLHNSWWKPKSRQCMEVDKVSAFVLFLYICLLLCWELFHYASVLCSWFGKPIEYFSRHSIRRYSISAQFQEIRWLPLAWQCETTANETSTYIVSSQLIQITMEFRSTKTYPNSKWLQKIARKRTQRILNRYLIAHRWIENDNFLKLQSVMAHQTIQLELFNLPMRTFPYFMAFRLKADVSTTTF